MSVRRIATPVAAPSVVAATEGEALRDTSGFSAVKAAAAAESTRRQVNNLPFFGGVFVRNVEVPAAVFPPVGAVVAHGLKRVPQGYIITASSSSPSTWSPKSSMTERSLTFYNSSGSPQTIDAWIF